MKRVNIRISDENHAYFAKRSEETGVSMSGLMALALDDYIYQREVVKAMNDMKSLVENNSINND